jgi:Bacterial Ig-like domain (group 3)/Beta-propeller repeat/Chitobiase/beta-hexosaminidase C-terminal domain
VTRFLRFRRSSRLTLIAATLLIILAGTATPSKAAESSILPLNRTAIAYTYNALPLSFEINQGQTDPTVKYLSRGAGFSALFKQTETDLLLSRQTSSNADSKFGNTKQGTITQSLLRMRLLGANENAPISGEEQLPGIVNYIRSNDPAKWHTKVPTFKQVKYSGVYAGTDLVYYGSNGRLEFDFELAPEADISAIRLRFDGASRLRLDDDGNLVAVASGGPVELHKPEIYQLASNGARSSIPGDFVVSRRGTVGFRVGKYDRSRPLVIDPILTYSTYFGNDSYSNTIAVDPAGEVFVAGVAPVGMPATPGAFQSGPTSQSNSAISPYIAKLNSSGTALVYCTYLSGSHDDDIFSMTLDANGDAYLSGQTNSQDFPTTPGALQTVNKATSSGGTAFISVLNSTGSGLIYSTFLGGSTGSGGGTILLDELGNIYELGSTEDTDFPTTPGAFQPKAPAKFKAGLGTGFVAKINPAGTALIYSTYLGGSGDDDVSSMVIDASGNAYIGGTTSSTDFPTTAGAFQPNLVAVGWYSAFVTKLNPAGSALVFSTYLSGTLASYMGTIAVDTSGSVYAVGSTAARDFPVTPGVFQPTLVPNSTSAFVTKFKPDGSGLVYSTFLGGSTNGLGGAGEDYGTGVLVDGEGDAFAIGNTRSLDFPVTAGAFETQNLASYYSGDYASFITKLNPTATALLYSTYFSGTGDQSAESCDCIQGAQLDSSDNVYVTGLTHSADFPATLGAFQPASTQPGWNTFVTVFNAAEMIPLPAVSVAVTSNANPQEFGQPLTFTATVTPTSGSTPTGTVAFSLAQQENSDAQGLGFGPGPWIDVPLNSAGSASYTPSWNVWSGNPTVTAYYLGDQNNAPGSGTMTQTVTQIPTTTTTTANPTTITWGQPITFTAQTLDNNGNPAPGSVSFQIGTSGLGGSTLNSAGTATWTFAQGDSGYNLLQIGSNTIEAQFSNSTPGLPYATSSATVTVTVNPLGTVPTPTFSVPAGTYTSEQYVYVNDPNSSASIYYTTDGTTPVAGVSQFLPQGSYIAVMNSETVQAIASVQGYSNSQIVSAAYTINLPVPDFTLNVIPGNVTVDAGHSASTLVGMNAYNGFNSSVSLSCSGLPAGVSCGFSPPSITPGGAGSTLTFTASATAGSSDLRAGRTLLPFATFAAVFGLWGLKSRRRRCVTLAILLVCATASACIGCGGGSNGGPPPPPPPTTSTITITGVSGSLTETATLSLTLN